MAPNISRKGPSSDHIDLKLLPREVVLHLHDTPLMDPVHTAHLHAAAPDRTRRSIVEYRIVASIVTQGTDTKLERCSHIRSW
jgi:hypothetical protein